MNNAKSTLGAIRGVAGARVRDLFPLAFPFTKRKFQLGIDQGRLRVRNHMSPEPTPWSHHRHQPPLSADRQRFSHSIRNKVSSIETSHSSISVHYGKATTQSATDLPQTLMSNPLFSPNDAVNTGPSIFNKTQSYTRAQCAPLIKSHRRT